MALDPIVKTNLQGSIKLIEGAGTTYTTQFDRGDFSGGPFKSPLNEDVAIKRRGKFLCVVPGDRIFPKFQFSFWVHQLTDATQGTIPDFVLFRNKYSGNISTLLGGALAQLKGIDIEITLEASSYYAGAVDPDFIATDCVCQIDSYTESTEGVYCQVSAVCYGSVTGDLACAEVS